MPLELLSPAEPGAIPRSLWDHLPLGVAVVDTEGIIRVVNRRLVDMAGFRDEFDLIGRSAFDLIEESDHAVFADGFARGPDFPDSVLGPLCFRFRDQRGDIRTTECWAYATPPGLGYDGYIVTLATESTSDLIAAATRGIAAGVDLTVSLDTISKAMSAYPTSATGSILVADGGDINEVVGTWAFPDLRTLRHPENPWVGVATGGLPGGVWTAKALSPTTARLMRRHGLGSVWVRPIEADGRRRGALVAWRQSEMPPTPNQLSHLREAVAAASLAFAQHDHRRRLQRAALEDHLTGVGNRARLAFRSRAIPTEPYGVLFVDLDFFKQVNDVHGHQMGDRVLRVVAERLTRLVRSQDEVYRLGGDEFVIVCAPSADSETARRVVERMARFVVDAIGSPFEISGTTVTIGASVGLAIAEAGASLDEVVDRADDALRAAKRNGRGRWSATDR